MIYDYFFIKCVVRYSENSVRFEKSYGNWLPDGTNSVRFSLTCMRAIMQNEIMKSIEIVSQSFSNFQDMEATCHFMKCFLFFILIKIF